MFKLILLICAAISLTFGCLITNCPPGGKRSNFLLPMESITRECPFCGPGNQGQCFGPNICCGTTFGCLIGTSETSSCKKESLFSRPCVAGFAMCKNNSGRCAANGICCSQDACYMDSTCRIIDDGYSDQKISEEGIQNFVDNKYQ